MKKISVRLAMFFVVLITASAIISFVFINFFNSGIKDEIKTSQEGIASVLMKLYQLTGLSSSDMEDVTAVTLYETKVIDNIYESELSDQEINSLDRGEKVYIPASKFHFPKTYVKIGYEYIRISVKPHNTMFKLIVSRVWSIIALFIIVGAILIALFANKLVRPILDLSYATREVAKGNFDVKVEAINDDEIGDLTKSFNSMTNELKKIEMLRKDFINNVSHEFKTPIASIQGFAKLLQSSNINDTSRIDYASIIVEESARLTNLSSNILRLSKLENIDTIKDFSMFSLDEQIRRCILLLESRWSDKGLDFDLILPKTIIKADEDLIKQVWINLLSNAIKYSRLNSTVKVEIISYDKSVGIVIKDEGIGMNEETVHRMFEKFYQGEGSHSDEGNGLGLSIVKRIIELHKGSILVESLEEKGTEISVVLPYGLD